MQTQDKVILVTGGAHRVGRTLSRGLAEHGAKVAIHYRASVAEAQATQADIQDSGHTAELIQGDFSSIDDVRKVVDTCVETFGRLDVLINNAAVYFETPLASVSPEEWDKLFAVNLRAPFFCAQAAAKYMQKQGSGKIINIADVSAYSPWPDYIPYCTTKAGLIALTKGLAKALAPAIQVNAIASGTVLMTEDATETQVRQIKESTLLQRIGSPQDILNTILFLLEGSDYITGEVIAVDGGSQLA